MIDGVFLGDFNSICCKEEKKGMGDEPKVEIIKISSDEEIEGVVKDVALKVELEDSNIEEDLKEDPD